MEKEKELFLRMVLLLAIAAAVLPFSLRASDYISQSGSVSAGDPYCWFNKFILKGCDWVAAPTSVSAAVRTNVVWHMKIEIALPGGWGDGVTPITDIEVKDRFGAEIEIDDPFPVDGYPTQGDAWWDNGPGNGRCRRPSGKVFLYWDVGTLSPGETATLRFTISTGLNGAGKQCYTSCGCYELNSGAVLKFMYNGRQYSVYSGPITVSVS